MMRGPRARFSASWVQTPARGPRVKPSRFRSRFHPGGTGWNTNAGTPGPFALRVALLNKPPALSAALARPWFGKFRPCSAQQEVRFLDKPQTAALLLCFFDNFRPNRKCTSLTNGFFPFPSAKNLLKQEAHYLDKGDILSKKSGFYCQVAPTPAGQEGRAFVELLRCRVAGC